ncbi:MAG TPA: serine hydrolase domain-containing protein [Dongiaceae bacterium]|nr:serine hydrolase domain-containing protein [Dongiaceae bacterium]
MSHRHTRRQFLARAGALGALAVCAGPALASSRTAAGKLPLAAAFDREMEQFMSARKVPGGALAVVKDQRLVYTRAYGWADREQKTPVKPDSLFRIASLSKPFTAAAVLKLVETKGLDLETPVTEFLPLEPVLASGKTPDPRWKRITLRHCLHHTGGWDRDVSGDPMFRSLEIAQAVGVAPPANAQAIIRYMLGQPLDFAPGARYAYSNFGYCLLGRVIERLGGRSYGQFVREEVLAPMSIRGMRLGASLESGRAEGEVRYYTPDDREAPSVFPGLPAKVPEPYGSFCLEALDAHGGWLASAPDLARFAAALDSREDHPFLKPQTRRILYEPPAPPVSRNPDGSLADHYYGCGWLVHPVGKDGRANYWHNGSLPGTFTLLVRRFDGVSWAALFNQRSESSRLPDGAIDSALHRAADAVDQWPG